MVPRRRSGRRLELTKHSTGQWRKIIDKQAVYFGCGTYEEALSRYHAFMVERGKASPAKSATPLLPTTVSTVGELIEAWKASKAKACELGQIRRSTKRTADEVATVMLETLGPDRLISELRATTFANILAIVSEERWKIARQALFVNYVRQAFRWAYESELIDRPPRFGPDFKRPPSSAFRKHKSEQRKVIPGEDIRVMLRESGGWLRTAILLAANSGMANTDVSLLRWKDINGEWIDHTRTKTGVRRVVWLWPETLAAMPQQTDPLLPILLSTHGTPLVLDGGKNLVTKQFRRLMRRLGMPWSFGKFRHTVRTLADDHPDGSARQLLMGHAERDVGERHYLHRIEPERVRDICLHVRRKLWPDGLGPFGAERQPD